MRVFSDNQTPRRSFLLMLGALLVAAGMSDLATRSIVRVWVTSTRNPWVLAYSGEMLLATGLAMMAVGVTLMAFSFQCRHTDTVDGSLAGAAALLAIAGNAGLIAAGICQAWLHVARLAIPGGWDHPRSLVAMSLAVIALSCGCFVASLYPASTKY